MATQEEYEKMSAAEKKKEDWMNSKWRPMMGWMYMGICLFDMVIFPILWSLLQTITSTMESINTARCWTIPYSHGGSSRHRGIWTHTRKT